MLALLPYANAITAGFVFDDTPDIRENTTITAQFDWLGILATPLPPGNLYRPFTVLTYTVNEKLLPGAPLPFHAVNVLLHAAVTIFVWMIGRRLFAPTTALIAAALFAVHPIHTEAVTGIVGRAELLAALFGLLTLLSAVRADHACAPLQRGILNAVALTSFCLALLSKESAITIVPLLMLFRIALRQESLANGLRRELRSLDWAPYVFCIAAFLVLRALVVERIYPSLLDNPLSFVPTVVRIRSAVAVIWDYFGLLNLPLVLAADYSYNQVPIASTWLAPRFLAGCALALISAVVVLHHRHAGVRFAAALPFVTLAVTSNILFPIGTIKAERLLYLPSVGWAFAVSYLAELGFQSRRYRALTAVILMCMVGAFAARTWWRNCDWKDNATLYASMVNSAPNSSKAHYNLGNVLLEMNEYDNAIQQFERALVAAPWEAGPALGLGIAYEKKGDYARGIEQYRKAIEIEPDFLKAHNNLCRLLLIAGHFDDALAACRRGLRYRPADSNLLHGLGVSLVGSGDLEKGLAVTRRAAALASSNQHLQTFLARLERLSAEDQEEGKKEQ